MLAFLLGVVAVQTQLAVTVTAGKISGSKAVVKLEFKNNFTDEIEFRGVVTARAPAG